jgi:hypothetical protein
VSPTGPAGHPLTPPGLSVRIRQQIGWLAKGRKAGDPILIEAGQSTWRSFEITAPLVER